MKLNKRKQKKFQNREKIWKKLLVNLNPNQKLLNYKTI